jgi:hypothetical protein
MKRSEKIYFGGATAIAIFGIIFAVMIYRANFLVSILMAVLSLLTFFFVVIALIVYIVDKDKDWL